MTIPNNYAQANFRFGGAQYPNGAEFTIGLGIASYPGTPGDLAADCISYFDLSLRGEMSNQCQLQGVLVKFGPDATGAAALVSAALNGTQSSSAAAPNVAYLFRKNTAFGGRHGRGRTYLPGVNTDRVDTGGTIKPAAIASLDVAMDLFLGKFTADGVIPVLLHADATVPYPITSSLVEARLATQRRRLRG